VTAARFRRGHAARADGRRAEWLAAWLLRLKGYRIVTRNLRTPVGELDLVARRGRTLAVVEVKRRAGADPGHAIDAASRTRIARATDWLLARRPDLANLDRRYDAVLCQPRRWPRHLPNAWGLCLALVLALGATTGCTPVGLLAGVGATAGVGGVRDGGLAGSVEDLDIQARLNGGWLAADATMFNQLGSMVHGRRVLVVGRLDDEEARDRALEIARATEGVTEVIDEIQVRSRGRFVDYAQDIRIATSLRTRLTLDERVKAVNIAVDAVGGVVYLFGVARSEAERERVIGHARDLRHARRVVDHLRVPGPTEPAEEPAPVQRPVPVESRPL
jgi:Holliday junction resolvase-like predicted endonuclease/osmotically-inducible protein OsmY